MIGALREHGIQSASVTSDVYKWVGAEAVVARYRTAGNAGKNGYTEALQAARRERAARPPSPAPPIGPATRRTEAAPATNAGLFNGPLATPPEDEQIIAAYRQVNRTLDDLPYTDEFERLYRAIDGEARGLEKHAVLHRLHNLRKAGRLPKAGRAAGSPPRIGGRDEASLRSLVEQAVGTLGQRDQLPYTEKFESLVEGFNAQTGKHLDPHDVWRLVAKLAK
jgi:hypothetical protein